MTDYYKHAGVDVAKGDRLVEWLKLESGSQDGGRFGHSVAGIGGFASIFRVNFAELKKPALVASTDGVGTKLLLGLDNNKLEGLGTDLVAMCLNDLYTIGATPLFFLDYYATGNLNENQFQAVLTGIKNGLKKASCPLIGGETAELPGLYEKNHFDLAGFVVGVVDEENYWGAHRVKDGDVIYVLPSSGFHSNGYSLVRKWLLNCSGKIDQTMMNQLLAPTTVYSELIAIKEQLPEQAIHSCANITGGGLSGNLPRVLPQGAIATIEKNKVKTPKWMQEFIKFNTPEIWELENTFNLGVGMCIMVDRNSCEEFEKSTRDHGLETYAIGEIRMDANLNEPKLEYV